jgi:putative oxidoreductase
VRDSSLASRWRSWAPARRSLLRIMAAFLVIQVGSAKLFAFGLFTRPVAFVLSGEMAVAYFYGHAPLGFGPVFSGE